MQELQENEIIKDIKDYEGLYAITSLGRVWPYPREKMKPLIYLLNDYVSTNSEVKKKTIIKILDSQYPAKNLKVDR